jgi:hypothetical protein|tara:strand:+ start:4742 stop:5014 length:273 start_codon:yes stop_codon:yes gene_type:complete
MISQSIAEYLIAVKNFKHATFEAGYTDGVESLEEVIEHANRFDIIGYNDNEDNFFVAYFIKGVDGLRGDYTGMPAFEGTLDECVNFLKSA